MEISKEAKDIIRYQPTRNTSADGNEVVCAYVEEYVMKKLFPEEKSYQVHFFIIDPDEMNKQLEDVEFNLLAGLNNTFKEVYEDLKHEIIIGGHFYPTRYREITTYLDTDLGLRTPPRESIQDWMERFSMIQNFVFNYSNMDGYGLHKWIKPITNEKERQEKKEVST